MAQLDGKVALITGAGGMKGIGRACALKLAGQGADIVVSDFRREEKDLPPQERKPAGAASTASPRRWRSWGGAA
jgi:NAD(P)-dependent dehydrogenase (short-subunit alcohol dehydrogenase family)